MKYILGKLTKWYLDYSHKICNTCLKIKDISEFNHNSYTRDGLSYECSGCHNKFDKEYRKKNPLKMQLRNRIWREDNPQYNSKYYWNNKYHFIKF